MIKYLKKSDKLHSDTLIRIPKGKLSVLLLLIIIQHTIAEECNGQDSEEGSCVCEDGWVGSGFREILELTDLNKFLEQKVHTVIQMRMFTRTTHSLPSIHYKNVKIIVKKCIL